MEGELLLPGMSGMNYCHCDDDDDDDCHYKGNDDNGIWRTGVATFFNVITAFLASMVKSLKRRLRTHTLARLTSKLTSKMVLSCYHLFVMAFFIWVFFCQMQLL